MVRMIVKASDGAVAAQRPLPAPETMDIAGRGGNCARVPFRGRMCEREAAGREEIIEVVLPLVWSLPRGRRRGGGRGVWGGWLERDDWDSDRGSRLATGSAVFLQMNALNSHRQVTLAPFPEKKGGFTLRFQGIVVRLVSAPVAD
jgi:hypothetical protein